MNKEDSYIPVLVLIFGFTVLWSSFSVANIEEKESKEGVPEEQYAILNNETGCFGSDMEEGTSYEYANGAEKVQILIKTSNPCYKLESFKIKGDESLIVYIELAKSSEACTMCIGYYKLTFRVNTTEKRPVKTNISFVEASKEVEEKKNKTEKETSNKTFCGTSSRGVCYKDSDCIKGGCYGELCQSIHEKQRIAPCEYKPCYNYTKYDLKCKCVGGMCQWV